MWDIPSHSALSFQLALPLHQCQARNLFRRLARAGNFMVARAAFDTSVSMWPNAEIELR
jgi:hypothetical protein